MERRNRITISKTLIKEITLLALPIIIQGIVFELQSLTDKAFLGHLKTEYVSAIGAAQLPLGATVAGVIALGVGVTIIVAHMVGAGKYKESLNYVKSSMLYCGLVGVAFFALWEIFAYPILEFFKVDPLIIDKSVSYVRICAVVFLGLGIDTTMSSMLQGMGKTRVIMYSGLIKVGFNILLSWILIFGKFGFKAYNVEGAAMGTLLANLIAFMFILCYCFVVKRKEIGLGKIRLCDLKFTYFKKVLSLGAPAAAEYMLWHFSNLILVRFINEFSYVSMSIYTVTFGIQCIVSSIYSNYSKAALTLIGQSLGAKNYKKANSILYNCMFINTILIAVVNIIFLFASKDILGIFINDAHIVDMGDKYLKFIGIIMFPQSLNIICGNAIKGNGNTKWMLFSQIIGSTFVICSSVIMIRVFHMNMMAIYTVVFMDETIRGIANYIYYKKKYLDAGTRQASVA